ncbi:hypothetical protein D6850_09770 [Roseovarius spongiae]|uniref:Chemotaxis protein CheA n=1 Tax=Roseovarius spongiae TaxID=2320272 RepID=A0A3A8B9W5_9RHOB|nr:hypothetical protein [Roseovarius spongiae]RKF15123.1 hypothetical protein D6850_09770 [Roseovarius spongiae]
MVSTSKILTVSYGTFSCTLEGFDDSFDTMKAIAEYFRDLAADDRYFGAEPPTPDAEMLARIAEREISSRVEAHERDGGIVLRAGALSDMSAPAESDEGADRPAASSARDAAGPRAEPAAPAPQDDAEAEPVEAPVRRPAIESESVADKLRRIRAVASPAGSAWEPSQYGYTEDEHAQDFLGATAADLDAALAEDDANEPEAAPQDPEQETGDSDDGAAENIAAIVSEPEEEDAPALAEPDAPTEDAQDDGFLAVVSEEASEDAAAPAEEPLAEETAEAPAPEQPATDAPESAAETQQARDEAADEAESIFAETGEEEDEDDADDEMLGALLADTPDETPQDLGALITDEADDGEAGAVAQDDEDALDEDTPAADAPAEDTLAQLMADAMRDDAESPATEAEAEAEPAPEAGAATEAVDKRPLEARVVKVKRNVIDAALADGVLEAAEDDAPEATDGDRPEHTPLSAEDEADLQRELAEVEAELIKARDKEAAATAGREDAPEQDETAADQPPATDAEEDKPKRAELLAPIAADDQAPRMFDEADSQLEEPESNERRNAIQHLRAAVAATKAEREMGGEIVDDVDDQPYRLDLESAVRPRRPQLRDGVGTARPHRSERPAQDRAAPLKLVAEQRIDQPAGPVRPRRISRADLKPAERPAQAQDGETSLGDTGFSAFAKEMGAHDLTELLEAAAAYMADVEGRSEFSRPMLMHKLKEASAAEFSREEGLRSFGKLLRAGKLQKLKGGRFSVTDDTDFRPKARATG